MGVVRLLRSSAAREEGARTGPSDGRLVLEARAGTRTAQEALFRRHLGRVAGLAHRLLAGSAEDVDDVIQDAFVQALLRLGELREPEAFGSWLSAIVVRTASKRLRRRRLLIRLGLVRREEVNLDAFVLVGASPERAAELHQLYCELWQFPTEERVALTLRRVEGLDTPAIAEAMGLSASTVKRRLKKAEDRAQRAWLRRAGA